MNGSTVTSTSFEDTGARNSWSTKTLTVLLGEGENTIGLGRPPEPVAASERLC